jgi:hypothetical protein
LTAPRIIFVPGMKPKPPPEQHRHAVERVLTAGLSWQRPAAARLLAEHRDWLTLISWTHRFYGIHRDIGLDLPGIDRILHTPEPSEEDLREIDFLARRLKRWWHLLGDTLPWLGRVIARPQVRMTMAEAHRYLQDRGGVARDIRSMLKAALTQAGTNGETILLIGHSLGSVIAYDALWELSHEDGATDLRVDLFVTLGSPLATRFIRRGLRGADRSGAERYPRNIRRWRNFSSRGDLTALHPRLAPTFVEMVALGLAESIEDSTDLYNHFRGEVGLNVHEVYGYLVHAEVAGCIGEWIETQGGGD